jgi:hypothetical protein
MTPTVTRTRILAVAILFLLAPALVRAQDATAKVQIIPAPKQIQAEGQSFAIGRDARIVLADPKSTDDRFAVEDSMRKRS